MAGEADHRFSSHRFQLRGRKGLATGSKSGLQSRRQFGPLTGNGPLRLEECDQRKGFLFGELEIGHPRPSQMLADLHRVPQEFEQIGRVVTNARRAQIGRQRADCAFGAQALMTGRATQLRDEHGTRVLGRRLAATCQERESDQQVHSAPSVHDILQRVRDDWTFEAPEKGRRETIKSVK